MNTTPELSIVIPAKNESRLLPRLLASIAQQDYEHLAETPIFIADAFSTDGTPEVARVFRSELAVSIIAGGLPAVGRNHGARLANSRYVLFIDADMELADPTIIRRAVKLMGKRQLHCLTTNIWCRGGTGWDNALYAGSNLAQKLSRLARPFSTGMFMLFDRERFFELGGFHEQALYAEDYLLSKKVARCKFGILPGHVLTTNRRFQKMGHWQVVKLFLKTALNTWNDRYFLEDQHYWAA